ncbi:hypothetical protein GCK72_024286 [Caenorhabditis remanei]|uniref:Uncharacterized protein n=1 Tax=Caenorhabditis remanei TaxID=31234 RepID=A0A6A5FYS1_CAERE|nr:hypothetical protein GCK72_024286 [Caenorhabditis remanei]KAF1747820.1 hypothetical protein GCK72_024286 [Caenorhabditis remanei]
MFFQFLARPDANNKTVVIVGTFVVLKLQKLIFMTVKTRNCRANDNYVVAPGNALAETTAQAFRCFAFVVEFFFIVLYSRVIAYMCETPASRNIVSAYTVVFLIIHAWEHLLAGINANRATNNL